MAILTDAMKQALTEQRLIFVATVCPDGTPNLSPKGTVLVWDDDHILFTDLASPGTMHNLEHNPAIEINTVDVFARQGFRFKGVAEIHKGDPVHEAVLERMRNGPSTLHGLDSRVRSVALIRVEQALPLKSPGYWGGATEAQMRQQWQGYWNDVNSAWHENQGPAQPSTS